MQTMPRDAYRPSLHFTAPAMWLNDPNGLLYENGCYHLYYQHNPDSLDWGPMHWGHAVSNDLLHWQHLPIALYPDALGTIFSGSAVLDEKNVSGLGQAGQPPILAFFTSHGACEQQSLAYSLDHGRTFQKYAGNPVVKNPDIPNFRDPKVFENPVRGGWSMVVSAHDRVHFYASQDLLHWEKSGEFGLAENPLPGSIWECPDLFPLSCGGKEYWVLVASMILPSEQGGSRTQYFLGGFDGEQFQNTHPFAGPEFIDQGFDNYAGSTYSGTPERIFLGWAASPAYAGQTPTSPFRGQMTLPRTVSLVKTPLGGVRLAFSPRGLEALCEKARPLGPAQTLSEDAFLLRLTARPGFLLTLQNGNGEQLAFGLDGDNRLWCDRAGASRPVGGAFAEPIFQKMAAPRFYEGECALTAVFDRDILEIYADAGTRCFTLLAFPSVPYCRLTLTGAEGTLCPLCP